MRPDDGRVISNFIVQALKGEDITLYGDGKQTRSFMFVDDLIEAMIRLMNTNDDTTGPVNLGNPVEFSIHSMATRIIELTGSNSKITYHELPADDPVKRKPDISFAKKVLSGWEPKVSIDEGLKTTINYFNDTLNL